MSQTMSQEQRPTGGFPAAGPARTAREMLGEALAALQEDPDAPADIVAITSNIARAVGSLFSVEAVPSSNPVAIQGVQQAMAFLAPTLAQLQDVRVPHPGINRTTEIVARTLAVLYPVSKAQERASRLPPMSLDQIEPAPKGVVHLDARRRVQRVPIEADIGLQSDTNFYTGFTEDISAGGIFVATYNLLPLGSMVTISFTLPDGHLVVCKGRVRWHREHNEAAADISPGIGVQFEGLSPADQRAITHFLARRAPMFYED